MGESLVFIATKPLQILISTAIMEQLGFEGGSTLVVVNDFKMSKRTAENIGKANLGWDRVVWVEKKKDAFKVVAKINPEKVFLDSDVGVENFIRLLILKSFLRYLDIMVYEEGVGSYTEGRYRGLKKLVLNAIGVGLYHGGSSIVSGVYVYNPGKYVDVHVGFRNRCYTIKRSVLDTLQSHLEEFSYIFEDGFGRELEGGRSECHLYLSSWNVNSDQFDRIGSMPGDKYFKAHPHIIDDIGLTIPEDFNVVPPHAPAELILAHLQKVYGKVYVYHHGSSVPLYVSENDNIEFVDLGFGT